MYKFNKNFDTSYDFAIDNIVDLTLTCDLIYIPDIRQYMYNIMITNIKGTDIIKDVLNKILENDKIPDNHKITITELAGIAEHNLIRGRREIIHLELFITGIMNCLHTVKRIR